MCELARKLTAVERRALRSTGGRHSLSGSLGVPLLLLWTRGARTGRWRSAPLVHTRLGDCYLVLGSNGGRPEHPQWTTNLLRNPRAWITVGGTTVPVHAHPVTGGERAALWPSALETWPPYRTYTHRSGRQLRMFRLTPDHRSSPGTSTTAADPAETAQRHAQRNVVGDR
ncbi:nitroreductase/quinone reductase family protein [Actinopolyspora saharensis]|uniref:Deazaflavin-dependent oxidoreductase, nitroreductase family n=1 Tax=Actinopolyspora saharensis TaxID=995062 RepID=A0A1H0YPK8_9ACTN|nr:nitroreductase/quinone reductase family protein [Actinopolyspora saharensis]SDQ17162.1 deazaflavin-dependent oxidoreductase, nitroreductase family [Actinopolyspora saharensis]